MSNSTTLLDTIATNQANKEVVVNALFDAASPAMIWGRHASACAGLTWGFYGGYFGTHAIANGTVTLAASSTVNVYADKTTGAVSTTTGTIPSGDIPLYQVVTGTTTVTSYTDQRSYAPQATAGGGGGSGTVTSVTLTMPSFLTVAGSPITTSGTLAVTLATQAANTALLGPTSGSAAAPAFRALVPADYPVFGASGGSHAAGAVPDPGATSGSTRFLREDGTWVVPSGSGGSTTFAGLTDVTITSPSNGQYAVYNSSTSKWNNVNAPIDLISYYPGVPTASGVLLSATSAQPWTFPASLTGSYANCDTAPTAAVSCPIVHIVSGTSTTIGSVNFAIGATSGTFTFTSAVTTAAGDRIRVLAPASPDATFAGPDIALLGTR